MLTATEAPLLVYFSSVSGNTARFIEKLGMPAKRIPLLPTDPGIEVDEPFVLTTPTGEPLLLAPGTTWVELPTPDAGTTVG